MFSKRFNISCVLLAGVFLAACDTLPNMSMLGPQYQPMAVDIAQMANPAPASGKKTTIHCRAGNGTARFGRAWHDFSAAEFMLSAEARTNVTLTPRRGTGEMMFMGYADPVGQKMIFCPYAEGPPDKRISCASHYVLEEDLADGVKRTFDIPDAIRGAVITCAYNKDKLRKL